MGFKLKKTYIYYSTVLALIVSGIVWSHYYSERLMQFSENEAVEPAFVNEAGEPDSLLFRRFSEIHSGTHWFEGNVTKEQLEPLLDSRMMLGVNRISSDWYRVYFNGITIGAAGGPGQNRSNHWNDMRFFSVPPEIIHEDNRIELEIHATYALGGVKSPVFITTAVKAAKLQTWFDFILFYIILFSQGVLVFSFLIYVLCIIVTPVGMSRVYFLISLSMLFLAVYLIEYIPFNTFFLPLFTTWKITQSSLFAGAALINLALWFHFRKSILLITSILISFCIPLILILFSGNILVFLKTTEYLNWVIVAGFFGWLWVGVLNYRTSDFAKTLFFTTVCLMILTGSDLIMVVKGAKPLLQMTVFGILTLAVMLIFLIATEYLKTLEHLSSITVRADTYYRKSIRDSMTGLYNHDYVIKLMKHIDTHYSFILIDIDDFKSINDQYGHPAGDDIILHVAEAISRSIRHNDIAGRYGGDEFTVILEGCSSEKAMEIAESIKVHAEHFEHPEFDKDFKLTVSIGVSEKTDSTRDYRSIISNADTALYRVKKEGKQGIMMFSESM